MKKIIATGMLALALAASAGNLLKNSTFAEEPPLNGGMPPKWLADNDVSWEYIDYDGIVKDGSASECLRYNGKGNDGVSIAWQEFEAEKNAGTYVIAADLKFDGCSPTVLVKDTDGNVLASLRPSKSQRKTWQSVHREFKHVGGGKLKVELQGCLNGETGYSFFDNVKVLTGSAVANQSLLDLKSDFKPAGPNIALGKKCTIVPKPNYHHCTDKDDDIQLTDGVYTNGYFWTQKSTVGWHGGHGYVTVDLGKHENICGASFNTAGGRAGVSFPSSICVFTSDDLKKWAFAGDLVILGTVNGAPAYDTYSVFRYASNDIKASGRYVQFIAMSTTYLFVDEVEIYGGGDGSATVASIEDPIKFAVQRASISGAINRIMADADSMEQRLADNGLLDAKAQTELKAIRNEIPASVNDFSNDFKAIFPFNSLHERIFAMNSRCLAKAGYDKPFVWKNNRWKNLGMLDVPEKGGISSMEVEMMRNEVRGETLNICNPTNKRMACSVTIEGIPSDAKLIVNNVLFTDTALRIPISDAIVPSGKASSIDLTLLAGCNAQIWLSFKRPVCKGGTYKGTVKVSADGNAVASVPMTLIVHDIDFPALPSIHVGGWDYTNTMGRYYATPDNVENTIAIMRDTYVDSPWATNAVMPSGARFDKDGHLTNAKDLDYTAWNKWTNMWKGARRYCVFWAIGKSFQGVEPTDPRFSNMITEYINAWMAYVKSTGFNPKNVVVLLFDEPHSDDDAKKVIKWSRPIKERCPDFTLFQDPTFNDPRPIDPEFFEVNNILCPNTRMMHAMWKFPKENPNFKGNFRDFYVEKRKAGIELWQYSCSGPSRTLDPITYHRGQFWRCVDTGAVGSMYWAFGCGGGIGNSWQPYSQKNCEYSPYFVGKTTVTQAKHNEAVREGAQDYEYFMMLSKMIANLKAHGKLKEAEAAQTVYDKALDEGLSSLPHLPDNDINWVNSNHHERMDNARITVLREIVRLSTK